MSAQPASSKGSRWHPSPASHPSNLTIKLGTELQAGAGTHRPESAQLFLEVPLQGSAAGLAAAAPQHQGKVTSCS